MSDLRARMEEASRAGQASAELARTRQGELEAVQQRAAELVTQLQELQRSRAEESEVAAATVTASTQASGAIRSDEVTARVVESVEQLLRTARAIAVTSARASDDRHRRSGGRGRAPATRGHRSRVESGSEELSDDASLDSRTSLSFDVLAACDEAEAALAELRGEMSGHHEASRVEGVASSSEKAREDVRELRQRVLAMQQQQLAGMARVNAQLVHLSRAQAGGTSRGDSRTSSEAAGDERDVPATVQQPLAAVVDACLRTCRAVTVVVRSAVSEFEAVAGSDHPDWLVQLAEAPRLAQESVSREVANAQ